MEDFFKQSFSSKSLTKWGFRPAAAKHNTSHLHHLMMMVSNDEDNKVDFIKQRTVFKVIAWVLTTHKHL